MLSPLTLSFRVATPSKAGNRMIQTSAPSHPATYLESVHALHAQFDADLALNPPLSSPDLDAAIAAFGVEVPLWLADLWREADGGPAYAAVFTRPGFFTGLDFLSLERSLALRTSLNALSPQFEGWEEPHPRDKRIASDWFPLGWIPFAAFGGSTIVLFADCAPGPGGHVGQVIAYVHDPDHITFMPPTARITSEHRSSGSARRQRSSSPKGDATTCSSRYRETVRSSISRQSGPCSPTALIRVCPSLHRCVGRSGRNASRGS